MPTRHVYHPSSSAVTFSSTRTNGSAFVDGSLCTFHTPPHATISTIIRAAEKLYRVGQKKLGPQTRDHNSVKSGPIKNFFTEKFLGKFVVKCILKLLPHLAYVATLPCETLTPAKQATNDKLQGSVAAYLRCDGVVNNQLKKGLLLSE